MTSAQIPSAGFARHNVFTEIGKFVPRAGRADHLNAAFCDQRLMGVKPGKKKTDQAGAIGCSNKVRCGQNSEERSGTEIHVVSANSQYGVTGSDALIVD
jgi:hypothetical protein